MTSASPPSVKIAYGRGALDLRLDHAAARWDIITPRHEAPIADVAGAFARAAAHPVGARPLRELAKPGDRIVIVTADGTRPVPNKILIPLILDQLGVPDSQVSVLLGTGTHRPNSPAEIRAMFGEEIAGRVAIINHDGFDAAANEHVGHVSDGSAVAFDRAYTQADVRIVVGFIEPHFFAGFSGGPKGVMPAIASVDTIYRFHRFEMIADPGSTYAQIDGNPTQRFIREAVALRPPEFLVNVTLNTAKEITAFFLGHYLQAHEAGCAHVKSHAMVPVERPYPVVITSNTGFPLDQNLYQSVKALSVAARIVEPGGAIVLVSECSDGVPDHGNFGSMISRGLSPGELLAWLRSQPETLLDQWQAQTLAATCAKARVLIHSKLDAGVGRRAGLHPIDDLQGAVDYLVAGLGVDARVAVLPHGPLTIPYVDAPVLAEV